MNFWKFVITARHLVDNLATDLYRDASACLWEMVRNAVCACMPDDRWVPGKGDVEIALVTGHPLSPKGKALVILDHGRGFTEPAIKLYCAIGASLEDSARQSGKGEYHGAAQKRIGRFAAFALNSACKEGELDSGFYILTRTSATGTVKFIQMIPSAIEQQQGVYPVDVDPLSAELGPHRGIKGSFTAIVIPNPEIDTENDLKDALQWRIPRKPEQMFKLRIGKHVMTPPRLASKVAIAHEGMAIEAYVDRLNDGPNESATEGGIWLTDVATGLRVTLATSLGPTHLPFPLFHRSLTGDIFAPGLLQHQDTSRSGLTSKFLKSTAWRHITSQLVLHVVPKVKALLGDDDCFGRDTLGQTVRDFVALCNDVYGVPEGCCGPGFQEVVTRGGSGSGHGPSTPNGQVVTRGLRKPSTGGTEVVTRPKIIPFRIGDKTYLLSKRSLDPRQLAMVDEANGNVLYINDRRYEILPKSRAAQQEHFILKVLEAVGINQHPYNSPAVQLFVADRRREMLNAKPKK